MTKARRSDAQSVLRGIVTVAAVLSASCASDTRPPVDSTTAAGSRAAPAAAASPATAATAPPAGLEPPPGTECVFDKAPPAGRVTCQGFPADRWKGNWGTQEASVAKWIRDTVRYAPPSPLTLRWPENILSLPWPRFTIAMVEDNATVALSTLSKGQLVVAKITADARFNVGPDQRYGIDRRNRDLEQTLYIVIEAFKNGGSDNPHKPQREVSRWRIYGIDLNDGKLRKVGKEGKFERCANLHDPVEILYGARFNTCEKMHAAPQALNDPSFAPVLSRLRAGRQVADSSVTALLNFAALGPSDSTSLHTRMARALGPAADAQSKTVGAVAWWLSVLADQADDPGWMTCGLGCCVADYDR